MFGGSRNYGNGRAFFSLMPFPAEQVHSLSHVWYTPHSSWNDLPNIDPYRKLASYCKATRFDRMIRDVARFVPSIEKATYLRSLFEIKTILIKNDNDDGRPILFETSNDLPGVFSVLGGKIDNIYDVLERLDGILINDVLR